MIKIINLQEDIVIHILNGLSDMSYIWNMIYDFIIPIKHMIIKKNKKLNNYSIDNNNNNTKIVLLLKSFFKKLCVKCNPIDGSIMKLDLYYSKKLRYLALNVLDIIPSSIFTIMLRIVSIVEEDKEQSNDNETVYGN